jgi:acetyl esterase/lipase
MSRVYDPEGEHQRDPQAWPYWAGAEELRGLPPHIVTNYELDLIRDEGASFVRRLQAAEVPAISRTITGATHVVELAMPDLVPELVDETLASIAGFAHRAAEANR